jgi:light-regulated signal transduction histidine kinase (bacteriophytochrome)/ActR/RegA family two-component response regulator
VQSQKLFDAIAHRMGDSIFLELEVSAENRELSLPELYRMVQRSVIRLQQAQSLEALCQECVGQVRRLTGFDRVMAYRFDAQWNGQVIAEDRRGDLEPFLGLHYPASDIPPQARALYTKNWLRFIPNRDYVPSPVIAATASAPDLSLDMSHSILRSVSPIHLEYLRNMGVRASMSISLIRDDKLWGLIACHHYASSRFIPYDIRTASELMAQMMSLQIARTEDRQFAGQRQNMQRVADDLLAKLQQTEDLASGLVEGDPNMLSYLEADGAAVVLGELVARIGQTPGESEIRQLSSWIAQAKGDQRVYATDALTQEYGSGVLGSVASGIMTINIGAMRQNQLIWFRTEHVRTVDWAGDPAKSITKGETFDRLSPRGSFSLWKETVKGKSKPWSALDIEGAQQLRGAIMRLLVDRAEKLAAMHTDLRLASEEREKALESERAARAEAERVNRLKDEFVATLSHELRTPLNAIVGWSQILIRKTGLDEDLTEGLEVIERNARSQAQMIEDLLDVSRIISGKLRLDLQHTHLPSVLVAAIETVSLAASAKDIRIEQLIDPLVGVETTGDPHRLQQVVWNLLTNAVKFTPKGGKIQVVLERVDSHVELSVADNGQGIAPEFLPHIFDRFRQADASAARKHGGLGLGLSIVRHLVEVHGGTVRAYSAGPGRGSTFTVALPLRMIQRNEKFPKTHPTSNLTRPMDCESLNIAGLEVLIVDDERDARALIRRVLEECDCRVTTAASMAEALALLGERKFDVIVSDVGMPGGDGFQFIHDWREIETQRSLRRIPAIALTAYARPEDRRRALLAGFQAHIAKPVDVSELLVLVASTAGRV